MKKIILRYILIAAFLCGGTACKQVAKLRNGAYIGPFYTVGNVYENQEGLEPQIKRVAMMPLTSGRGNRGAERGVPQMQVVLTEEFSRNRIFDIVTVTSDRMQRMFSRRAIYADEPLPHDFLQILKRETGCQAVLFTELTTFRAYPPVALGWKIHLFDLESEKLIWAADEVFDGGQSPVANSLRRHIRKNHSTHNSAATELLVLDSPREMARYSLSELISTIVKKNPKEISQLAESIDSQKVPIQPVEVGPQPAPKIEKVPEDAKKSATPREEPSEI